LGVYLTDWFDKVLLSYFRKKTVPHSNREIIERNILDIPNTIT